MRYITELNSIKKGLFTGFITCIFLITSELLLKVLMLLFDMKKTENVINNKITLVKNFILFIPLINFIKFIFNNQHFKRKILIFVRDYIGFFKSNIVCLK